MGELPFTHGQSPWNSALRVIRGLATASIFMIGIWLLGFVPQATAETLNHKAFNHFTKSKILPIADVEGHFIGVVVREGVALVENVELAWVKTTNIRDLIKAAGMVICIQPIRSWTDRHIRLIIKGR